MNSSPRHPHAPSSSAPTLAAASGGALLLEPGADESFGTSSDGSALSPLAELLETHLLEDQAYPVIYARGVAYAQGGNILRMDLFQNVVAALVAGSADEPYVVKLSSALTGPGGERRLYLCSCSCPFATDGLGHGDRHFCKHMVAVGLAAGAAYARQREAFLIGQAAPAPQEDPDALPKRGFRI